MPNDITNRLAVQGVSDERVKEILEAIKNDEVGTGSIDFNKIIPMPDHIFRGPLGQEEQRIYGKDNWYDWGVSYWGTSRASYGYDNFPAYDGGNRISFLTAWSRPEPVIEALSRMFPDAEFEHAWADEDIGSNVGECVYQDGEVFFECIPDRQSAEAYEMAADIIGIDLEEYGFVYSEDDESYHYIEELDASDNPEPEENGGMNLQ